MLYDVLAATRLGVILLQTFLRFLRKKALKNIETSEKLLRIKEPEVYLSTRSGSLPMVGFKIPIEKKAYLKLEPQRLLIELTCDNIPLKTFFWYKGCNIDDVVAPDLEAIGDGYIEIKYPCVISVNLSQKGILSKLINPLHHPHTKHRHIILQSIKTAFYTHAI